MKAKTMKGICGVLITVLIGTSNASAAKKAKPGPVEPLTEKGQKLEAQYAEELQELKADLTKAIPSVDEKKIAAVTDARAKEKAAEEARNTAQKNMGAIGRGAGLVAHAKGKWIGGAEKGIADTKEKLKAAKTDEEREELKKTLAKWEQNKQDGLDALKERQAIYDKALADKPRLTKELDAAKKALAEAQAVTMKAVKDLGVQSFLESDKLDADLAQYVVISEATPRGLAQFAEQGKDEEKLIDKLLDDDDLMIQICVADGAKSGKYGEAMKIYAAIQKASKRAKDGALQKLALGISLEHAVPIGQRNPVADEDAPKTVDPVKRYLHYEKAYLDGELDKGFAGLSVWDYRFVVDGSEPDETLAWGREMLHNYRPDHIATPDYRWRYVQAVRTEIRYGSQYNQFDKPELQFFQNILMNGGVCGRRAFFGRFMLRAFGIPTTARPQPGHAALAHWTPDGWVVCLGGGWGAGTTKLRYKKDLDFLASTQARENREDFMQVKRAQWVGDVVGEKPVYGLHSGKAGLWYGISLYKQREIIEEAKMVALAAVGTDIGEANESKEKESLKEVTVTEEDRKIVIGKDGVITIPAVACTRPTASTGKIKFMDSVLGGKQLHYGRTGTPEDWEYSFEAPKAGKYELTARVVTPTGDQHLMVAVNDAQELVDIVLPLTVGMWDTTKPVEIELAKGRNFLKMSRSGENIRGLTIKDFTLTPVR